MAELVLVDTCILSDWLRNREPGAGYLRAHLAQGGQVALSRLAWYERERDLRRRGASAQRRALSRLCREAELLDVTAAVLEVAADLWAAQMKAGKPVPEIDLLLAATARHHEIPIATRDTDFRRIEGVQVRWWGDPEN